MCRTEAAPDVIVGETRPDQTWQATTTTTTSNQQQRQSWETKGSNLPPPPTLSNAPEQEGGQPRPDLLSSRQPLGSTNLGSTSLSSHHISGLPPAPPTRRSELPPRHPKDQVLLVPLAKNFKRCEKLIIRMWRSRWGWQGRRWQGTMGERHLDIFLLPVDQCPQARVSKISNVVDHFDSLVQHNNVQ